MKEQLISFETAVLAKEKGFDWLCNNYTNERDGDNFSNENTIISYKNYNCIYATYSRPTQSLLQKWLREVHNIHVNIDCNAGGWYYELMKCNGTTIYIEKGRNKGMAYQGFNYETYEEALEAGLQESLKLI
jgi:hypothetical protein